MENKSGLEEMATLQSSYPWDAGSSPASTICPIGLTAMISDSQSGEDGFNSLIGYWGYSSMVERRIVVPLTRVRFSLVTPRRLFERNRSRPFKPVRWGQHPYRRSSRKWGNIWKQNEYEAHSIANERTVAQRQSGGLISRRLKVRFLPVRLGKQALPENLGCWAE